MSHRYKIFDPQGRLISTANNAPEAAIMFEAGQQMFPSQTIFEVNGGLITVHEIVRRARVERTNSFNAKQNSNDYA